MGFRLPFRKGPVVPTPAPSVDPGFARAQARRLPILALVLVVGGGAIAYDRVRPSQATGTDLTRRVRMAAIATPAASDGSAWFCPMVSDAATGAGTIAIAVPGAAGPVTGTVTVHGPSGPIGQQPVTLDGASPLQVRVADITGVASGSVPTLGAVVELSAGGAAVEARVPGAGNPAAPCSSAASSRWWFADGATVVGSSTDLVLFNPFPEDALVDLRFITDRGVARPGALQGLAIPGGSVRAIPLERYVRRRSQLGTAVAARSGRVVAAQRFTVDGVGSALVVGAPEASRTWFFPDATSAPGLAERYELLNPGVRDAVVDVAFLLQEGDTEPFTVTVARGGRTSFVPADETRIPKGVAYAVAMIVTDGSPIVVQRTVRAAAPARRRGLASLIGSARTASRWVLAEGGASNAVDERVTVLNPFDEATEVRFTPYAADGVVGLPWPKLTLAPGARAQVRVGDHLRADHVALVVSSDGAGVVVQRDLVSTVGSSAAAVAAATGGSRADGSGNAAAGTATAPATATTVAVAPVNGGRGFAIGSQAVAPTSTPNPATSRPATGVVPTTGPQQVTRTTRSSAPATAGTAVPVAATAPPPNPSAGAPSSRPSAASTTIGQPASPGPSTSAGPSTITSTTAGPSTTTGSTTTTTTTSTSTTTVPVATTSTVAPGPQVAVAVNTRPRLGWSSSIAVVAE